MSSPGEAAEALGWSSVITLVLSGGGILVAVGTVKQWIKTADEKLAGLRADMGVQRTDHDRDIREARELAEKSGRDLVAYREFARDKFAIAEDLRSLGTNLSEQIKASHAETRKQVEELRVEFGKKGIDHTINTAIQRGMAQLVLEMKKRDTP